MKFNSIKKKEVL